MQKITAFFITLSILVSPLAMSAGQITGASPQNGETSANDPRQLVTMPEESRQIMQQDMIDHLAALNEIIAHLANENFDAAAETAETRMGRSSMGKHRGTGKGPGRFMPPSMHVWMSLKRH